MAGLCGCEPLTTILPQYKKVFPVYVLLPLRIVDPVLLLRNMPVPVISPSNEHVLPKGVLT